MNFDFVRRTGLMREIKKKQNFFFFEDERFSNCGRNYVDTDLISLAYCKSGKMTEGFARITEMATMDTIL